MFYVYLLAHQAYEVCMNFISVGRMTYLDQLGLVIILVNLKINLN